MSTSKKKGKKKGKGSGVWSAVFRFFRKTGNRAVLYQIVLYIVLAFLVITAVILLKIRRGTTYENIVQSNRVSVENEAISALRGNIYDSTGVALAVSTRKYRLFLDGELLNNASQKQQKNTVRILCELLNIENEDIISQYLNPAYAENNYILFSKGSSVDESVKEKIDSYTDSETIIGVFYETIEERTYPNGSLAAHILGFNGVYGVEQYYDKYLLGTDGRQMKVYNSTKSKQYYSVEKVSPVDGCDLTLTINAKVQSIMESALLAGATKYKSEQACAICINPQTGEIYGWCNVPTFDLNDNTVVIGAGTKFEAEYGDTLLQSVWNNFGLTYTYQPGSTYKPIFASIALEEGTIGTGTTFKCTKKGFVLLDTTFECFEQQVHGTETVRDILVNSCNQGMVQISKTLSAETYLKYQNNFGIGHLTGIDLAGEVDAATLVYDEDSLGPVEKATSSFGQGFNVTPIQLITAFASVINGGELLKPYVVSRVTDADGNVVLTNEKTVLRHTISEETSAYMRSCLGSVISKTWGSYYKVKGYTFGGKTGTAQQGNYDKAKDVVSFISFTSVDNPEVLLLVVMSANKNAQSKQAAEVSLSIMKQILPVLGIYPEN